MNLIDYFTEHGHEGLKEIAEKAGTTYRYLLAMLYDEKRIPSLKLAIKLIEASDNLLTVEGLANPVRLERRRDRRN